MLGIRQSLASRLERRMLLSAAIGILVIGLTVAVVAVFPLRHRLRQELERDLVETVHLRRVYVEEYLRRCRDVARQIGSRTKAREALEAHNRGELSLAQFARYSTPILRDALRQSDQVVGITRLDRNGEAVLTLGAEASEVDWGVPPPGDKEPTVHGPVPGQKEWLLTVSSPILDREGERVGTDVVLFSTEPLARIVRDYAGLGETGEVMLGFRRVGGLQLIYPRRRSSRGATQELTPDAPLGRAVTRGLQGSHGILADPATDETIAYSPVFHSPWAIAASMNRRELFASLWPLLRPVSFVLALLILLGTCGMYLLLRPLAGRVILHTDELAQRIEEQTAALQDELTVRHRVEQQLRVAKEAAESANRAKSAFLANMSHELRTPLNAVIGYSEMLHEDAVLEGRHEEAEDLAKIRGAGRHLLDLINQVLDLSKIEADRVELHYENIEVAGLLRDLSVTVQPLVRQRDNRLEIDCPEDPGALCSDVTRVRQILLNLLANAAKFTDHGHIRLQAAADTESPDEWIVFAVSDTGIGIPTAQLDRIFEPFTQADGSTTREFGGTGLGLSISRKLSQLLGGSIDVESEPGHGSIFSCRLPRRPHAKLEGPSAPAVMPGPEEPGPLLVIDDDAISRSLLQRLLGRAGYRVITAGSGEEGLELARRFRPRAITLDIMMPLMDGWTVLGELKRDPVLAKTPVIVVSVDSNQELGYALGAAEFLGKPVDPGELLSTLRRLGHEDASGPVLVVEDDAATREMLEHALSSAGHPVITAANGRAALELLDQQQPSLILLDLLMPEMDGFEFLRHVRHREGLTEVPIIVITAKDLTSAERRQLRGEAERVLQKGGLSPAALLTEIQELLRRSTQPGAPPPAAQTEMP